MTDFYTEDLAEFGARERRMAAELLAQPLPEAFYDDGVKLAFNKSSGYVFLVNSDYQCAMMNGDSLEIFHSTPYEGKEGFLTDLLAEYTPSELNDNDVEYLLNAADAENVDLDQFPAWANRKDAEE